MRSCYRLTPTALLQTQLIEPELARSAVTGMLKQRTKWLALSDEAAGTKVRHRSAQWENLEKALMQWFGQICFRNAVLTDRLLLEEAKVTCSPSGHSKLQKV